MQPAPAGRNGDHSPQPSRKPEAVEVTSPRLYVGNLSYDATESDLFDLFNGVGHVQNAEVVSYRHNQRSKGFAFVQMQTIEEAKRAVEELHDKDFLGRKLVVSGAKSEQH
jgi:RNA recognition motif-containing protein